MNITCIALEHRLKKMASEIHHTIENGHQNGATVDVEFYEKQLDQIREYTARARLRELHRVVLKRYEELHKKRRSSSSSKPRATSDRENGDDELDDDVSSMYRQDTYTPMMSPILENDDGGDDILDELEDARDLRDSRLRVLRESRERLARLARKTNKTINDDSKLASKMYVVFVCSSAKRENFNTCFHFFHIYTISLK